MYSQNFLYFDDERNPHIDMDIDEKKRVKIGICSKNGEFNIQFSKKQAEIIKALLEGKGKQHPISRKFSI